MSRKTAKADVIPVRQQNQYNCMTTSLSMALRAQGVPDEECDVQRVNKVVGAMPLRGAAWEPLLAAANHFGMRATLTLPSTVRQLKQWTDAGIPVVIAWNPEGREWSHASLVFDVDDDLNVHVADPNIPDPDETVRVVPKAEFYDKWYEKSPQGFMIRRPACAIEREITADGRQVMASRVVARKTAAKPTIRWEPVRHTMTPVWEGTPSTRREPGGGNWGGSVWGFNIIQKGEPNETQPGDNYLRGGNQPGTEYWQVEIWPASEGGTRKPWIKPKKKWKTLKAAQDWSLKVLQGRARVPGLRVAGTADGRQVMASSRWEYDDPNFQSRVDKALEGSMDLQAKWPSTPAREYAEYRRRRKKHPNDVAYEKARAKIWKKHLRGTGWTEDEWEAELEKRMDSRMDSRRRTAGVISDFMDMESYKVAGTGRPGLSLTPITYAYDAWEDFGKDGAVSLTLGRESVDMSPQRFATFAADMKKALNWASRYNYEEAHTRQSPTASAKRVASAFATKIAAGERLDRSLRQKINKAMERKGLDGNGRFRKPEEGYSRAVEVMQEHGIELDEVVSSHLFNPRPSGTVKADIALTNEADRFSPVSITNSMLYLQYTEVSDDRFEVVAYLS